MAGKVVLQSCGGEAGEEILRKLAAEGARVVFDSGDSPRALGVTERVDAAVYELPIGTDFWTGLAEIRSRGRDVAREMAQRGGGCVICAVPVPGGTASDAALEAARAALRSICAELVERWGSRGVRANAVVYARDTDPSTTVVFLASGEASGLSGEILGVREAATT